jgi:hypothetical protein|tara:strand:+ start:1714 stop:2139 length:426 start_codon:yes stop_codon:yes gene_type:complete
MRFYNPGPIGGSAPGAERIKNKAVRQHSARRGSAWGRSVVNANGNIAFTIISKPNGSYNQGGVFAAAQNAGSNRIAIKIYLRDGSQLDGMILSMGGIAGLPAALRAKADLDPHFYIRVGNTEDEALDAGSAFVNAVEFNPL